MWAAEFKALPPGEHDAVRERIRADLVILRGSRLVGDRSEGAVRRQDNGYGGDKEGWLAAVLPALDELAAEPKTQP